MEFVRLTRVRWMGALLVAGAALGLGSAAEAKELKWKFKEGDKVNYALRQKGDMNINAGGVELEIKTLQIMDLTWTVKAVGSDGTAELTQTVDRMQMKLSTPFTGDFEYDSKNETPPEGQVWQMLGPFMEGMLGQEFTMKISPAGVVSDIVLPAKLTEAMAAQGEGGGGGRGMMMGGGFSEESIKELVARAVINFPAGAVSGPWEQKVETKMGPLGTQVTTISYKLDGEGEAAGTKCDKIAMTTELTLEPAAEAEGEESEDAPDIEMEITEQEGSGSVLFDSAAGRTLQADTVQTMTMEGDFMGNEFIQERELVTLMVMGTSDALPPLPEEPAETAEGEGDSAETGDDAKEEADEKEDDKDEGDDK